MEEGRSSCLAVLVGTSKSTEELRRLWRQRREPHLASVGHLRGVRRCLTLGQAPLVVVCVALEEGTLNRHGEGLRRLLDDLHAMPGNVRSVGLLPSAGLTADAARLGCDVYVAGYRQSLNAIQALIDDGDLRTGRVPADQLSNRMSEFIRENPNVRVRYAEPDLNATVFPAGGRFAGIRDRLDNLDLNPTTPRADDPKADRGDWYPLD